MADQPSAQSERQIRWIEAVLAMAESEDDGDHFTSHAVFCRKVLGEEWGEALQIASLFHPHRLTRDECIALAHDWRRCDECGAIVPGGTPLCGPCDADQASEAAA